MRSNDRYWDFGWQLIEGCTRVSPACDQCWSLAKERRFRKETGVVCHPERLERPLRRRKPASYSIWNDLFHKEVSDDFIGEASRVTIQCPQHTFYALTKRADRMAAWTQKWQPSGVYGFGDNVWLGVTVENQDYINRVKVLLQIPAAKHFVSFEPLLSHIDFQPGWEQLDDRTDWHWRLMNVTILQRDAFELLDRIDDKEGTVIYADPPYIVKGAKYIHDFTDTDHARLAGALKRFKKTRVVLSYYDHPRLLELYPDWARYEIDVTRSLANARRRGENRAGAVEVLLVNEGDPPKARSRQQADNENVSRENRERIK